MKWLLIIVLSLVAIVLIIVLIGALLPQKHHVSRTVSLHQRVEVVWNLISGPPNWRPDITNYQDLPPHDGHRMWRETDKHGQTITYETVESSAPRRLVVRIADPKLPFGGTWTYDLAPSDSGCSLTITEDGEVYNPLFRFVSRFIMGHTATIDSYVKAMQQKLGS
ncbi:MAG TPA: SRPBCC family protein [Candidatus Angelobacter sp.]|nr:SRPBCC family protein [Candidatus Angelobacter sp.]